MRNMSFAMTTHQMRNQTKDVTRRFGWWFAKQGDIYQPVEKGMGLKPGEKIVKIGGPIEVVSVRSEPLNAITKEECIREGFPDWDPQLFIAMMIKHYRCHPLEKINRIEFKYL